MAETATKGHAVTPMQTPVMHEYSCFQVSLTGGKITSRPDGIVWKCQARDHAHAFEQAGNHVILKQGEQIAVVMTHI